jgi:hypothetical protein
MLHAMGPHSACPASQEASSCSESAALTPPTCRRAKARTRRAGIVGLIAALGVLLAACSSAAGAGGAATTSTTAKSTKPSSSTFQAYTTCLKNHGVSFPSGRGGFPGGGAGGGAPPSSTPGATTTTFSAAQASKIKAAQTACASLRPKFTGNPGNSTALAAYRNCLKLHGVTLPNGRGGAGGFFGGGGSTATTSNPKLQAAMTACAALRPKGGFGGGAGGFHGFGTTTTTS